MPRGFALLGLLPLLGPASTALAEHEPDHRYVVLGYVADVSAQPASNVQVRAIRHKTGAEQRTRTDADGFYLLIIHLHTEDLGDAIRVLANGFAAEITARFDPLDVTSHRGTRIDFLGPEVHERPDLFAETLGRYLAR